MDYSLFFDKDSVFGCVSANLLHGSVLLKEYEAAGTHKPLVQLTFVHLLLGAEYRMKTDTTIMSASLQVQLSFIKTLVYFLQTINFETCFFSISQT